MTIGAVSYIGKFRFTLNVDDSIMKDPEVLMSLIEKHLENALALSKN